MADYDVIVIGAGLGGLSAGALLAKQGRKVLVLEQSGRIGGCCSTFEKDGFCFDVGASIVEIIQPIERVFRQLGTTLQAEVDLISCDPMMTFAYEDGKKITFPLSAERTGEIIAEISPEDGRHWKEYAAFATDMMEVVLDTFFAEPASTPADMAALVKKNPRFLKYLPVFMSSYQDVLEKFFHNETVLKTMGNQALYFGLPPELVPGPYGMVPFTEHLGIYYPRGGMIRIPAALQRCGERHGMELRTSTRVERVLVRDRRVVGVELADGTEISTKLVVSNVNARSLYLNLIGEEHLSPLARRGIKSYEYSASVPMIYLGLDYEPPLEAHHTAFAASPEDVNRYWHQNFKPGRLTKQNFGLICWPTHADPSLAPAGRHVLNLIPEGFYDLEGTDWDAEKQPYIERTIENLSHSILPGLKEHIVTVECSTPLDFERRLLLPKGAIYCFQQDLPAQAIFRPAARSKQIAGLYLAGACTHPGGGVPTTIASGMIAAGLIDRYEKEG
jgi:phytoene desaturase